MAITSGQGTVTLKSTFRVPKTDSIQVFAMLLLPGTIGTSTADYRVFQVLERIAEQAPSLTLGQIELKLGSPEEDVIAKLAEVYDLRRVEGIERLDGEHWTVSEKGSLLQAVGGVGFKNGELSFASRNVAHLTEESHAVDLANALFSLFESFNPTGTYTVKTSLRYGPEFQSILFRSTEGKTVVMGIARSKDKETAITLEEGIGWPEPTF